LTARLQKLLTQLALNPDSQTNVFHQRSVANGYTLR
jgi:hypothetical protein